MLATTRAFAELAHDHGGLVAAIGARLASELGATCDVQLAAEAAGFDMAHATTLFAPFQRMHTVREVS